MGSFEWDLQARIEICETEIRTLNDSIEKLQKENEMLKKMLDSHMVVDERNTDWD